ncbi:MAG: hypothetical protein LBK13_13180, partial [Spirochaetales bacterium]|nr:hypothetical protein [Spirochaetales bacterium]
LFNNLKSLCAHTGLFAKLHEQFCCSPMRPGWWQNREAILRCRCARARDCSGNPFGAAKRLKRKARFAAFYAANAPKF